MLIHVGCELKFNFLQPTPLILMLSLHPSRDSTIRKPENLCVRPWIPLTQFVDANGNRCARVVAPVGSVAFSNDAIVEDCGLPDLQVWDAQQSRVEDLPPDALRYLLASRYCEVDSELQQIAWNQFSRTQPGWPRVKAICDFVQNHIRFDYQQSRSDRTALGAYGERVGVCRDFMHLAITFCRCMNIPARYCTGYLGDIGVPVAPYPMDFSAWFEAYLGNQWYTFDARHNVPRIGRVLMARGRDAADVAMTTSFGSNQLQSFEVWTDEAQEAYSESSSSRAFAQVG